MVHINKHQVGVLLLSGFSLVAGQASTPCFDNGKSRVRGVNRYLEFQNTCLLITENGLQNESNATQALCADTSQLCDNICAQGGQNCNISGLASAIAMQGSRNVHDERGECSLLYCPGFNVSYPLAGYQCNGDETSNFLCCASINPLICGIACYDTTQDQCAQGLVNNTNSKKLAPAVGIVFSPQILLPSPPYTFTMLSSCPHGSSSIGGTTISNLTTTSTVTSQTMMKPTSTIFVTPTTTTTTITPTSTIFITPTSMITTTKPVSITPTTTTTTTTTSPTSTVSNTSISTVSITPTTVTTTTQSTATVSTTSTSIVSTSTTTISITTSAGTVSATSTNTITTTKSTSTVPTISTSTTSTTSIMSTSTVSHISTSTTFTIPSTSISTMSSSTMSSSAISSSIVSSSIMSSSIVSGSTISSIPTTMITTTKSISTISTTSTSTVSTILSSIVSTTSTITISTTKSTSTISATLTTTTMTTTSTSTTSITPTTTTTTTKSTSTISATPTTTVVPTQTYGLTVACTTTPAAQLTYTISLTLALLIIPTQTCIFGISNANVTGGKIVGIPQGSILITGNFNSNGNGNTFQDGPNNLTITYPPPGPFPTNLNPIPDECLHVVNSTNSSSTNSGVKNVLDTNGLLFKYYLQADNANGAFGLYFNGGILTNVPQYNLSSLDTNYGTTNGAPAVCNGAILALMGH